MRRFGFIRLRRHQYIPSLLAFLGRPETVCVSGGGRKWGWRKGTEETDAIRDAMARASVLPASLCWSEQRLFTLLLPKK